MWTMLVKQAPEGQDKVWAIMNHCRSGFLFNIDDAINVIKY